MPLFPVEVKLEQPLPPQQLEDILVAAATDVGWKVRVKDQYREKYKYSEDGRDGFGIISLKRERVYTSTDINLRGMIIPAANVNYIKTGNEPINRISIGYGLFWGVALRYEVEKYLGAVSERLKAVQPPASLKVLSRTA